MSEEHYDFLLPSMGEGVHEATVVKWLKKTGDFVQKDEPLVEVSTDKVDTEIVSSHQGYLIAIFAVEGKVVVVEEALAQLSSKQDATPLTPKSLVGQKMAPEKVSIKKESSRSDHVASSPMRSSSLQEVLPTTHAGNVRSSPLVRKMAKELGVDLGYVSGSGLFGRITKDDLLCFLDGNGKKILKKTHTESYVPSDPWQDPFYQLETTLKDGVETLEGVPVRREKMSKIRRLTAEHMLRSVRVSPHVTTTFEINLTNVVAFKKKYSEAFQKKFGEKLTYTPFFIFAAAKALKKHPEVNTSVSGDDLLFRQEINIACAVATDSGLIVPVLKGAGSLGIFDIAVKLNELVHKARNKGLAFSDIQGGTFSVTNPGLYGSLHSQPIINQPQVAIMSIGSIVERPIVVKKELVIAPLCQVGLTFDHRAIDGEGGAKFLSSVRETLEGMADSDL